MAGENAPIRALPITSAAVTVLGAWFLYLSMVVIRTRRALAIAYGDGGVKLMGRRIRAHGNFVEYTPMFLALLAISEYQGVIRTIYLGLAAVVFTAGRIIHGRTFLSDRLSVTGRLGGMFLTLLPMGGLVAANIIINAWPALITAWPAFRKEMHWVNKDILFILRESFNLRQHLTAFLKYLIRVIGGADLTDASGPDMAASPAAASTEA